MMFGQLFRRKPYPLARPLQWELSDELLRWSRDDAWTLRDAVEGTLILGATGGTQTLIVTNGRTLTVGNGSIVKPNGRMIVRTIGLTLAGGLTNEGVINISGGSLTIAGPGKLVNATNGLLVLGPSPVSFNGVMVENAGNVTWSGGDLTTGQLVTFQNLASGIWEITGTGRIMGSAPPFFIPAALYNAGVVRKSAGTGTNSFGALFNSGTVDVRIGWIQASLSQTAGSTLLHGGNLIPLGSLNIQGGSLSGTGLISGSLASSGTVGPGLSPGILNIATNYSQTATGDLNIELRGRTAGTQYDRLNITGAATLDGTLNVTLINGFLPSLGDSFRIMNYGSRTGAFVRVNGLSMPGTGLRLDPIYSATGLTLVTTNEPALSIQRQGNDVLISWSAAYSDWTLQSATNLGAPV